MRINNYPLSPILMKLWIQSHIEAGISENEIPSYETQDVIGLYPKSFLLQVRELFGEKKYDFSFRGAVYIDSITIRNRTWIIDFAKKHFSKHSFFQITDARAKKKRFFFFKPRHTCLGDFDLTFKKSGFVPKEIPMDKRTFFDEEYYQIMCDSKFTLCPAGDANWSMRFHEAIMSKSIPIVENDQHSGRNDLEYNIDYKFYLASDKEFVFRQDWVDENYEKFIKYQTLSKYSINV